MRVIFFSTLFVTLLASSALALNETTTTKNPPISALIDPTSIVKMSPMPPAVTSNVSTAVSSKITSTPEAASNASPSKYVQSIIISLVVSALAVTLFQAPL